MIIKPMYTKRCRIPGIGRTTIFDWPNAMRITFPHRSFLLLDTSTLRPSFIFLIIYLILLTKHLIPICTSIINKLLDKYFLMFSDQLILLDYIPYFLYQK